MITKKEIIWREILYQALEQKQKIFTQKELAAKFGFSVSTVFNALKAPRGAGAVKVTGRNFELVDFEKLLYLWATFRKIKKDIVYQTKAKLSALDIEGNMPDSVVYAAFSAYRQRFNEAPADYDRVYVYAYDLGEIKKRFSASKGYANLFILEPDPFLKNYGKITTLAQTFADLWNLPEWYAKDFSEAVKEKIHHGLLQ